MYIWKIILRKTVGELSIKEDTCEAATLNEARQIFEERHGVGLIVAGPFRV